MVRRGLLLLLSLLVWSGAEAGRLPAGTLTAASCAVGPCVGQSPPAHVPTLGRLTPLQPDALEDVSDEDGDATRIPVPGGDRPLSSADLSSRRDDTVPRAPAITRRASSDTLPPSVTADAHGLRGPPRLTFPVRETAADRRVQLTD